jgi:hypothetical protein
MWRQAHIKNNLKIFKIKTNHSIRFSSNFNKFTQFSNDSYTAFLSKFQTPSFPRDINSLLKHYLNVDITKQQCAHNDTPANVRVQNQIGSDEKLFIDKRRKFNNAAIAKLLDEQTKLQFLQQTENNPQIAPNIAICAR